ncbi:MAG: lysostaphin resistance A-like protein [Bacteroidales bacterium]
MRQGKLKNISLFSKVLLLVGFAFFGALSATLIMIGLQTQGIEQGTFLKLSQVLSLVGIFLFPAVTAAYLFSDNWKNFLYLENPVRVDKLFYVALLAITIQPLMSWLVYWNTMLVKTLPERTLVWVNRMEGEMNETMNLLLATESLGTFIVNVLIIGVLTAIGEEFFFRGTLQRILTDASKKPYLAAIVIGILFSIIHFQFYGFFARAFMGVFFGIMVVNSKSLLLPVVAHAVNNIYGVSMYYYYTKEGLPLDSVLNPSEPPELWMVGVSVVISALLYRTILRIIRKKNPNTTTQS